jgi:hypothetical protein
MVFTGAPYDQDKDSYYAGIFNRFEGKKAISGGTTANLLARELGRSLKISNNNQNGDLPPLSEMEGVDLITEGILTLTRTLTYLENGLQNKKDSASVLVGFLLKSDVIHFMTGASLNQAHYDPNLPVEFEIRRDIVKKIASVLIDKYLKNVTIRWI